MKYFILFILFTFISCQIEIPVKNGDHPFNTFHQEIIYTDGSFFKIENSIDIYSIVNYQKNTAAYIIKRKQTNRWQEIYRDIEIRENETKILNYSYKETSNIIYYRLIRLYNSGGYDIIFEVKLKR